MSTLTTQQLIDVIRNVFNRLLGPDYIVEEVDDETVVIKRNGVELMFVGTDGIACISSDAVVPAREYKLFIGAIEILRKSFKIKLSNDNECRVVKVMI